jgi:DNA-binding MarR family transcriptional regulator
MSDELASDLRVVIGTLMRRLREQSSVGDLTRSQQATLGVLERGGPATASVLARAQGMRPQSMGAIVASLQEAGLITGDPDPADGRRIILSLTDAAREEFRVGRLAREDYLSRVISSELTPAEQEQLASAIDLIRRLA